MNKEEAEALVEELQDAAKEYKDTLLNDFPEGGWRSNASRSLDEVRERVIAALVRGGD